MSAIHDLRQLIFNALSALPVVSKVEKRDHKVYGAEDWRAGMRVTIDGVEYHVVIFKHEDRPWGKKRRKVRGR